MTFSDLGLGHTALAGVADAGYTEPTPIQQRAIPTVLQGSDLLGCAQTGTGKTASFVLPMLDILAGGRTRARMPRSLILEPTRELAMQVAENFDVYGAHVKLTKALLITVVHVAKTILPHHALLLPEASNVFLEAYLRQDSLPTEDVNLEVGEGIIKFTSQWLLNQLVIYLHRYMSFRCIHKKFGTILFRKGGDTLTSLSWAMGRHSYGYGDEASYDLPQRTCHYNSEHVLEEAGHIVNDILHKEIDKVSENSLTDDPSSFNIDTTINNTDKKLWKFLQLATRTTRERRQKNPSSEKNQATLPLDVLY